MSFRSYRLATSLFVLGTAALVGCTETDDLEQNAGGSTTNWWRDERALRQAALDGYLANNAVDYAWFKNAPLGNSGVPMIMFRLFPELFPEIWGPDSEKMAAVGLGPDTLEPTRVLPLGLGHMGSQPPIQTQAGPVNIQVVQLTCMGCHGGKIVDAAGQVKQIIGAPSTTFSQFRLAVARTVNHPGYTADAFRAALNAKPLGWVYGNPALVQQEALERAIFNSTGAAENFLATLKTRVNAGAVRFQATLGTYTYADTPNAPNLNTPKPGYLDAIGAGITIIVDPAQFTPAELDAILPPAPAEIDIMSVWLQRDRPFAQWDGSIMSKLHRNLAAEFGVVGNPAALNMENAVRTTRFTENLPSTPYPFDINRDMAARGQVLYGQYCASCHAPGNADVFTPAEVATDGNRSRIFTPYTTQGLRNVLRAGCTDTVACNNPDGSPVPDEELVSPTGGYMAVPLAGIWARAPYLHNGSVPTLYALLTGDRPATFYRGNLTYDQKKVGFTWDAAVTPYAAVYDTRFSGLSNGGHLGPAFNGPVDWKRQTAMLADLLEYMKTL